jgi:AraC-like DNA-binding protein
MRKFVFTTEQLPEELDDAQRFSMWRDLYNERHGDAEIGRIEDRPFHSHSEFTLIGDVGIARCAGTFGVYERTKKHVATDTRGDFLIGFLHGNARMRVAQRGRELTLTPGQVAFYTNAEPYENLPESESVSAGLCVPRALLLALVPNAEDLLFKPLDPSLPAARHLARYIDFLLTSGEVADDPQLMSRISTTLIDLMVLSLGANGAVAEAAQARGLRAARVQDILAEVQAQFSVPNFSARNVADKLGLSARYVHDLLQETGVTFTEHVLELRLQKARTMVGDAANDRRKISEIAFACGFSDISYFNQCFRRRFGASPRGFRIESGGSD